MQTRTLACFVVAMALAGATSAQTSTSATGRPGQPASAVQSPTELYHVQFVKAAPGRLNDLVDLYLNTPPAADESARPIILRHVDGDDWDLAVLQPLGKETVLRVTPTREMQETMEKFRPLRAQHTDTYAVGPAWAETRTALLGESGSSAQARPTATTGTAPSNEIDVVTVYRALPGHRDQLESVLKRLALADPGRTVTLQHMEGAAWDFVTVTRYASWSDLGNADTGSPNEQLRAQGFTSPEAVSLALREHVAEHRDTITTRVTSPLRPAR